MKLFKCINQSVVWTMECRNRRWYVYMVDNTMEEGVSDARTMEGEGMSNEPRRRQWIKVWPCQTMTKTKTRHCVSHNFEQTLKKNVRKRKINLQTTKDGSWRPRIEMEKGGEQDVSREKERRTRCFLMTNNAIDKGFV